MLTPDQLDTLGRMRTACDRISDAIQRLNSIAIDTGLEIRLVSEVPLALTANDISQRIHEHFKEQDGLRAKAMERLAA